MEKVLNSSRFLVLFIVIICSISAILLYVSSLNVIFNVVLNFFERVPASADGGKRLAVQLLKILDTLLIAVTFQIIAVGLYRLFISGSSSSGSGLLSALKINDFHDLKITLIQVAMVIMVVLFLEQAVEIGATLETLYFGASISLVILTGVYAAKSMGHRSDSAKLPITENIEKTDL
ncbi:YqhA family protein [Nitrincola alkalilacustris]|uniref:YqhA family protein n=1 Tax=Nitrincola alkalilacustris TaxID=1571224 RepID=UPI00124DCF2B|nr:YqhA family protein [Nitrincola alkalilacustris]